MRSLVSLLVYIFLVIALVSPAPTHAVEGGPGPTGNNSGFSGDPLQAGGPNIGGPNNNSDTGVVVAVEYADGGLVTCQGPDCNACDLVNMVNKIVNFLITLLTVLATIVLVIAGFKMVTSGGNSTAWQSAKESLFNIVIGFILVLAAWLIVDTILKALTGTGLEVWGVITC